MVKSFVVSGKDEVSGTLVWVMVSSSVSLIILTFVGLTLSAVPRVSNMNLTTSLPFPIALLLVIWGMYAAAGSTFLWVCMWIYWARIDRSSVLPRVGWFFTLSFGMQFGAIVYACYLLRKGLVRPRHIEATRKERPN